MSLESSAALWRPHSQDDPDDPNHFVKMVGGRPDIVFDWKYDTNGKRRLIGNPNKPMRRLHELFGDYIRTTIRAMKDGNHSLILLPSSTAFVKGSNPLKNAAKHADGKFFYITDILEAYRRIDLKRLASCIVYIKGYAEYRLVCSLRQLGWDKTLIEVLREDWLFLPMLAFLESFCAGPRGEGLAVGGPLSPYLFNLYCEVYCDAALRRVCETYEITFTRYADDYVFSREKPICSEIRWELRRCINRGGFEVNHRKSRVLSREMGTVHVTKVGLHERPYVDVRQQSAKMTFPQKKRRKLHGMIKSYVEGHKDWPEKVSGFIAEFLYYFKKAGVPTKSDRKTFALCREFEREWAKYRK